MTFSEELKTLINKHSMENVSDTPDFILAEYMINCLVAFEEAIKNRDEWYSADHQETIITTLAEGNINAIKQLEEGEAIKMAESGIWKDWSDEEIVRFQLFQNRLCMDFDRFQVAMEKVLNRSIFTHEFACRDSLIKEYLGKKQAPTFEEIIGLIPEEKRILILV